MQCYAVFIVKILKMINQESIKFAAQKWAIDTNKKFPHLSEPEFIAGAKWALSEVDPLCNSAAEIVEKLQAENVKLREVLEISGSVCNCRIRTKCIMSADCKRDSARFPFATYYF